MSHFSKKFNDTYSDIKSIRIQGAERVAWKGSVAAANEIIRELELVRKESYTRKRYLDITNNVKHRMLSSRPTEPALNNAITLLIGKSTPKSKEAALLRIKEGKKKLNEHFETAYDKVAVVAKKELSQFHSCYTHCHSSLAVHAIIFSGIRTVHNTETRPLYQGRKTARELSRAYRKMIIHHYVDSAMRTAISKADCIILGADSITMHGDVINKVGTGIVGLIAEEMKKPVYVIADSYKLDLHSIAHDTVIEERNAREVWNNNIHNVLVHNPAFEKIKAGHIYRIICESGSYAPKEFVKSAVKNIKA
jgi:translation initiation factor 2B subunit (eIF-2B alpha/beta/delta family)